MITRNSQFRKKDEALLVCVPSYEESVETEVSRTGTRGLFWENFNSISIL